MFCVSKSNEAFSRRVVELMLNKLLSSRPEGRLKVNVSPESGSVADSVPTTALAPLFSAIELFERVISVGGVLTVMVSVLEFVLMSTFVTEAADDVLNVRLLMP